MVTLKRAVLRSPFSVLRSPFSLDKRLSLRSYFAIFALVCACAIGFVTCNVEPPDTDLSGNTAKTLKITGYPGSMESGTIHFVCIFLKDKPFAQENIQASSYIEREGASLAGGILTLPLKNINNSTDFAGSGTYDVWISPKGTNSEARWYKASAVPITNATTEIPASSFVDQGKML